MIKLYQCPYEIACKCAMDEPCNGCESFKPNLVTEAIDRKQEECALICENKAWELRGQRAWDEHEEITITAKATSAEECAEAIRDKGSNYEQEK